ncbi:MAG TPA: c-type cytochrome [Burkholderiales bacterium]|nr:c-type cytochrome [Burkholderiales bacterium]
MSRFLAVVLVLYIGAAHAAPDEFAFGDAKQGQKLYAAKCAACHAAQFGGDGSRVFTRPDRRIHTPAALLAQVQDCNVRARAGLSAEDEQSVAAWLNERYYKFK